MSNPKKSLKEIWNAATAGSVAIGIAASVGMTSGIGSIGLVAGAVGLAGSTMAAGFRKKPGAAVIETMQAEMAVPEEMEISVETGQPVKAMKQIRLRR